MSEMRIGGIGKAPGNADEDARLRQVARQLEGVFVEHLFKAMRETVPEGGIVDGGAGEEIFSGLMDQHLSERVPAQWERGLGSALYRQLKRVEGTSEGGAATPSVGG